MFESNPSFQYPDSELELSSADSLDIPAILLKSDLPGNVREACRFRTFERVIDDQELRRLTESQDPDTDGRLATRRKALAPYLGSVLVCVLIRMPGVIYTVEIDPRSEKIAYWEWQRV